MIKETVITHVELHNQRKLLISLLKQVEDKLELPAHKRAVITQKDRRLFEHLKSLKRAT